jgi:hypothetical protein
MIEENLNRKMESKLEIGKNLSGSKRALGWMKTCLKQ